jgi:hypothetical protein
MTPNPVPTVISGPMPAGRSYLSIVASVAVDSRWMWLCQSMAAFCCR